MKKRLLLALVAMCVTVSGFALEQGEYVYTPQGRFLITDANLNANNAFQDMTGWTVVGEGKTLDDKFNIIANGLAEGFNSVKSIDATIGEGMYFEFVPTDANATYVVSYKIKSESLMSVRNRITVWDGNSPSNEVAVNNVVKFAGNPANTYGSTEDEVVVNKGEEVTDNWQTFNYAIVGDGTPRTYYFSFTGIATSVEIADLQIAPAMQFANLRQRDAMLEKLNVYKNCFEWDAAVLAEFAFDEAIENLQAIGDESGQATLDEQLATAQEILDEFLKANMDDYLGSTEAHLGIRTASGNLQKQSTLGGWTCVDRGFWSNGAYPDLGHYQYGNKWGNGNPTNPMGVTLQKQLVPGSYVFAIEANAALRENAVSKNWTNDDGLKPAYAIAYIVKVDGAEPDTVVSVVKDLDPVNFTPFFATAKIEEAGTYEFGIKAYCKEAYQNLARGSVTYVANASIFGKNGEKYNQKELGYETDVREQITTGRTQLNTAAENIANPDLLWGKADLQACVDTVETKIAAYELLTQDDIIATYQEDYAKSTSAETGYLVYTIYQEAVKYIIEANRKFAAVNDTLTSLASAIQDAEKTMAMRVYGAATGKDDFLAVINDAKTLYEQMKASVYSEENAAAIKAANATLAEAVEAFKASVPASAIASIVDIDFENNAVQNEESGLYGIAGAAGTMEFSNFSIDGTGTNPFEQGLWSNGEQLYKGFVRVGNGTGTVNFDPKASGAEDMGTNILKFTFDYYVQGLSGQNLGFFIKDEEGNNIAGIYYKVYNDGSTVESRTNTNTFGLDLNKVKFVQGSAYNDAEPEKLPLNSFEIIMDYGKKAMYCSVSNSDGSATSQEVSLEAIPSSFVVQSSYSVASRRCWFDNLKIQRITTGAVDPGELDGIMEVNPAKVVAPSKVLKNGRLVINGKYGVDGMLIK